MLAGGMKPPKAIYTPTPDYPSSAIRDGVRGKVTVQFKLPTDGVPKDIEVLNGIRPDIDQKAVEAVRDWRFSPATQDGKPIQVSMRIEVTFNVAH